MNILHMSIKIPLSINIPLSIIITPSQTLKIPSFTVDKFPLPSNPTLSPKKKTGNSEECSREALVYSRLESILIKHPLEKEKKIQKEKEKFPNFLFFPGKTT